ncbi:hypothetical protein HanRHA438_Chr12g0539041 [Helianthus annuus]|nr:hypothetical protein HanPI659440_Chr09g0359831 [Helianthus annuus]KAJ0865299.1 hypothetical protein HanRHA438_Chr12g0539041 [Helianthus annuus]
MSDARFKSPSPTGMLAVADGLHNADLLILLFLTLCVAGLSKDPFYDKTEFI